MKRFGYGLAVVILASALVMGPVATGAALARWVAVATMATAATQRGVPTETIYKISPAVPEIYCNWVVLGVRPGDRITGNLVVVDAGQAAAPNTTLGSRSYTFPQSDVDAAWGHFEFQRPGGIWPSGYYVVEIMKNRELVATVHFMISN